MPASASSPIHAVSAQLATLQLLDPVAVLPGLLDVLAGVVDPRARLRERLDAGDPNGEVTTAWVIAQDIMAIYQAPDADTGRQRADALITHALACPVPQIQRLGRTLRAWRSELLAYFSTDGSNGPTEAVNLLIEATRRIGHGSATSTTTDCYYSMPTAPQHAIMNAHGSEGPIPGSWRRAA